MIAWMGIGLRCIHLLFNYIVFRYILGYSVMENRRMSVVILIASTGVLLPAFFQIGFRLPR